MTKGWVDVVIRMRVDKEEAKQFCLKNLKIDRQCNKITAEEYKEMKEYILAQ